MSWSERFRRLSRTLRFRLTATFCLAAIPVAAFIFAVVFVVHSLMLRQSLDAELRSHWHRLAEEIAEEGYAAALKDVPPRLFVAVMAPDFRTYVARSREVETRGMIFVKPDYAIHGERTNRHGFWAETVQTGGQPPFRVRYRVNARRLPNGDILAVARGLGPNDRADMRLFVLSVCGFLLMAALLTVVGGLLAKQLAMPIDRALASVDRMAAGDFSVRLRVSEPTAEMERLAHAINIMAANTESLLADLRAVTDNIAHDLRTPVTRLRTRAELALGNPSEREALPGAVAEECDRMMELITAILEIARLAHGIGVGARAPEDLARMLAAMVELYGGAAEEQGVSLRWRAPRGGAVRVVNAPLLRRALANLLDNALRYTPRGGHVAVGVTAGRTHVRLWVADDGPGVPPELRPRLFDRFVRGDASRTGPGFGLGLALVRAIAQALGGQVAYRSPGGKGSLFVLRFPAGRVNSRQ